MKSMRIALVLAAIGTCALPAGAQIAGSLQTVDAGGAVTHTFSSRDDVFLAIGSAATPCAATDFFSDGVYYFQVTDSTGRLLSTDPVASRVFTVNHGSIDADGITPPVHATGPTPACGEDTIALAPFSSAGPKQAAYLVWVTPISRLEGSATAVDPTCSAGCSHGFRPEFSRILAFRVEDQRNCQETFCVSGVKFEDLNGNGVRDAGEPGIAGVEIRVQGGDGPPMSVLTRADGSYQICGLTSSATYHVSETVPSGYSQTGPRDHRISRRLVARGLAYDISVCDQDFTGLDFGNQRLPNAIGGVKFEDLNANGVRDPGEPPVAGVTINWFPGVSPNPTGASRTAVTDANGNFLFTNVTPGPFFLVETPPAGFTPTVPVAGFIPGTLTAGGSILDNLFGNFRGVLLGSIAGEKFLDSNGDGIRNNGEGPLAGVTITISGPADFAPQSTTTGIDGKWSFGGLSFGTYTIAESVPAGYQQTAPPAPGTLTATLNVFQRDVSGLVFGNRALSAPASISGTKFIDANGNGARDTGELGGANVTIRLQSSSSGGTNTQTTTAADGSFSFTGLAPGTYVVSEVVPVGFVQTAPGGAGTFTVTVAAGETRTGILFGNQSTGPVTPGSISGTKYLDLNTNGIVDGIDRPLEGITIVLTAADGSSRQIVSGTDGTFRFDNVVPGTYTLSEILPPNFAQTFPGTPTAPQSYTITVAPGQNASGFLFLNKC